MDKCEETKKKNEEKEVNPTIRRSALMRTPPTKQQKIKQGENAGNTAEMSSLPQPVMVVSDSEGSGESIPSGRGRALSLPEINISLERVVSPPCETKKERPAKRKREPGQQMETGRDRERVMLDEELSRLEMLFNETRDLVKKVRGISDRLNELVAENPNTKKEIKRGVEELEWASKRLEVEGRRMERPINEVIRGVNKTKTDADTQTEGKVAVDKVEQEDGEVCRIQELLHKGAGVQEFLAVAQDKWPQKCYKRTRIETKDIFELSREWDLATMVPENFDMEHGDNKKLRDHFQGVEELKNQDVGAGGVAYLAEQVEIPGKDDGIRTIRRHVYYGVTTESSMNTCNVFEVQACLTKIRDLMGKHVS